MLQLEPLSYWKTLSQFFKPIMCVELVAKGEFRSGQKFYPNKVWMWWRWVSKICSDRWPMNCDWALKESKVDSLKPFRRKKIKVFHFHCHYHPRRPIEPALTFLYFTKKLTFFWSRICPKSYLKGEKNRNVIF